MENESRAVQARARMQCGRESKVLPTQHGRKAGKIRVRGDPFASGFDGNRRMDRIRDKFAAQVGVLAESPKDAPMTSPRPQDGAGGASDQSVEEAESLLGS